MIQSLEEFRDPEDDDGFVKAPEPQKCDESICDVLVFIKTLISHLSADTGFGCTQFRRHFKERTEGSGIGDGREKYVAPARSFQFKSRRLSVGIA
jgi:hypothetical protein